jgi:tetratricopeptide (TPR) repeat protein
MPKLRNALNYILLGLGLSAVAYGVSRYHQDTRALRATQAQSDALIRHRQEAKQNPQDPQAHLRRGDAALAFWRNSDKGIRISLQSRGWNSVAWLMEKPNVLKEATTAYITALRLDPQLARAQVGLCIALLEQQIQGQEAKVTATCRKAIVLQPQVAKPYLALGLALSQQKQWSESEAMLRKHLMLIPEKSTEKGNAYYQLGKVLLAQQKTTAAVTTFRRAIELDPQGNLSYVGLGDALTELDKTDEAIAAYRQSLTVTPEYPPAYVKLGDHLVAKKEFAAARDTYQQMVERYPTLASGHSGLGRALTAQQKWEEAIIAHNNAIELDPKNPWNFMGRGTTLAKQSKLEAAISDYSKAIQLEPNNIWALVERGVLYARQNKTKEALADFNWAVKLEPNSASAQNALCWNGSLLGQAAQVIAACDKAIAAAQPQEKDVFRDSRGVARALLGYRQGAIEDLQAFVQWSQSDLAKTDSYASDLQARTALRQRWIQALQKNHNPFTAVVLRELLTESSSL